MNLRPFAGPGRRAPNVIAVCLWIVCLALPPLAAGQQEQFTDLAREAIQNQLNDKAPPPYLAWMERNIHGHHNKVEHVIETPSGTLSRVTLIDNLPLTASQKEQEDQRVQSMIDPEAMARKLKSQQEDDARTRRMLAAIPDAFDFQYVSQSTAANGDELVTLKFTPHDGFNPPNRETMVFTGMRGDITLDRTAKRIVKIDGRLFKDVTFGWGILGRLYKGGQFLVEQAEVTPTHWDTTRMHLHFDGKVLFFKSIHIDDNETSWDYKAVPPMSVKEALAYLNHTPAPEQPPHEDAQLRR